jgi:predicted RNA-binding Zn ribbon-like protein
MNHSTFTQSVQGVAAWLRELSLSDISALAVVLSAAASHPHTLPDCAEKLCPSIVRTLDAMGLLLRPSDPKHPGVRSLTNSAAELICSSGYSVSHDCQNPGMKWVRTPVFLAGNSFGSWAEN